ncbi:MAG TPA: ABC transporter permease [Fulvivirga sp.]|nr:ABC transporter permease [Fulvivirga sp.]
MLKNLIKISVRNILKEKGYSTINIVGLAIGITCSIFLLLYVLDELSYDRYNTNADNIYRVVSNIKEPDNSFTWAVAQIPLADEVRENNTQVVNAVRFFGSGRTLYKYEDKSFNEEEFYLADSTVFDMFTYEFLEGDKETALDNPNSLVLTESVAIKYFGTTDCLNKALTDPENKQYNITGVIKDVPQNSHFRFDALISRNSAPEYRGSWGNFGVFTYLQFPDGYDPHDFQPSLDSIIVKNVNPIFERMGISISYELQKITDIHLHSKIQDEAEEGGDISYIYIFSIVAAFMLIIASINYMNLATARSFKRAKEVGIRKVMGSLRGQLISQFITESLLLTLLSLLVSLGAIYLLLPYFNDLANKSISYSYLFQGNVIIVLIGIVFLVGIVGGSYPAFYLSRFNPAEVLKGRSSRQGGNSIIRKILVVLQFSISIFMLISTLVVFNQLNFLRDKDLGFNKEQVLRLEVPGQELRNKLGVLRNSWMQLPGVVNVATASTTPGSNVGKVIFNVESNDGEMMEKGVDFFAADFDYLSTLGMTIVEGRDFSRDILSDTIEAVLVNEAMVDRMAWTEPLGKKFEIPSRDTVVVKKVVGVIKDYNQNSLYDEIEPLMVMYRKNNYFTYIKMDTKDVPALVKNVESDWKTVFPNQPFEYKFLDQDFDSQYAADQRRGTIFTIFSSLTIVIACLGLLGLTSFTTEQRTKEIGIRKVIGASLQSIVFLVSKEFLLLVVIATIIAFPVAYYFMSNWLQAFAYKINLNDEVFTFILSAILALFITLLTVGFHTVKAAMANPVKALRSE